MPNATTIPRSDAGKRALLQHLSNHLTNYVTILEITPADLTQVKTGFDWFDYSLKLEDAAQNYTDAIFAFKRVLRDGPKSAGVDNATGFGALRRYLWFSGRFNCPY
ncbi:hypothetical protein [Methylobacter sp. S3L5C]|uniref:hypothetical protein n=1 Tax=Methylobacter sp. S3L5C TaxID=2839024 RepID=UPI001FAE24DC|nr:hypothetical protein [Methylobacter sp. S3L5C]UOA07490.1 hypothetical protein KKZ03_14610 [Methylobacter sp. S3L5C]